jgi:hypothetical protein
LPKQGLQDVAAVWIQDQEVLDPAAGKVRLVDTQGDVLPEGRVTLDELGGQATAEALQGAL